MPIFWFSWVLKLETQGKMYLEMKTNRIKNENIVKIKQTE